MWQLVFVVTAFTLNSGQIEPRIEAWYGEYTDMFQCFEAREKLGYELTGEPGYFPQGTQAVCIHLKEEII